MANPPFSNPPSSAPPSSAMQMMNPTAPQPNDNLQVRLESLTSGQSTRTPLFKRSTGFHSAYDASFSSANVLSQEPLVVVEPLSEVELSAPVFFTSKLLLTEEPCRMKGKPTLTESICAPPSCKKYSERTTLESSNVALLESASTLRSTSARFFFCFQIHVQTES